MQAYAPFTKMLNWLGDRGVELESKLKTDCYCIYCPNHPLFNQRHDLGQPVTGFTASKMICQSKYDAHKREVDCLEPVCEAITDGIIDPLDYDFPTTAYGDGISQTGFDQVGGLSLFAYCGNERYEQ